jgi:hypothetical protein
MLLNIFVQLLKKYRRKNQMRKIFCDGCGVDMTDMHIFNIDIPIHICTEHQTNAGYSDQHGNSISGRRKGFDLCPKCSNQVYAISWKTILSIQHGDESDEV